MYSLAVQLRKRRNVLVARADFQGVFESQKSIRFSRIIVYHIPCFVILAYLADSCPMISMLSSARPNSSARCRKFGPETACRQSAPSFNSPRTRKDPICPSRLRHTVIVQLLPERSIVWPCHTMDFACRFPAKEASHFPINEPYNLVIINYTVGL